jgi:hypothetical protein
MNSQEPVPEKTFDYFDYLDKEDRIQIQFKTNRWSPELKKELHGFLATVLFGLETNIEISFQNLEHFSALDHLYLMDLGVELKSKKRKLILTHLHYSLVRFMRLFGFDKIVQIDN